MMPRARKQPSEPTYIRAIARIATDREAGRKTMAEGPTAEQKRKAAFRRAEGLMPGDTERAHINETENRLRELEYLGVLNARQREAGERFEEDYWIVFPSTSPKDSTVPRVGGQSHETEAQADSATRAAARIRKVKQVAGPRYIHLRCMAIFRDRVHLCASFMPGVLDQVAEVYGLK